MVLRYRAADPNGRGGQGMHKDALNLPAPCYWCCSGRLKLSDDQVLLQRCFPLNRQLQLLNAGELPFSSSYEKKI